MERGTHRAQQLCLWSVLQVEVVSETDGCHSRMGRFEAEALELRVR